MNKKVFNEVNAIAVEAKGNMVATMVSALVDDGKKKVAFKEGTFIRGIEEDDDIYLDSVYIGEDDNGETETLRLKYHTDAIKESEDIDIFDLGTEDILSIAKELTR